jgi:hypothetical protein
MAVPTGLSCWTGDCCSRRCGRLPSAIPGWPGLETGTDANLVSGGLQAGGLWLATQKGEILVGDLAATKLDVAASAPGADLYGVVAIDAARYGVAHPSGVGTIVVQQPK